MKRLIYLGAVLSMLGHALPAHAQMADALGKPLEVSDLEAGTVAVRVIAGEPNKPVGSSEVKLKSPDGSERVARTDPEGRATFTNLQPGSRWVASAAEPQQDGKQASETSSEEFTIPQSGGVRLMLSTRPWAGGGGGGAAAGAGGGGMPPMLNPRQMSGTPRPDAQDPGGLLTVSALQGTISDRVAGHPIHLIGYGADGSVTKTTQVTDAGGRARFDKLTSASVAYYAITSYRRGPEEAPVTDRLNSQPIMMPPEVGVRLMLAGLARDSREPAVDDLDSMGSQLSLPAGTVNVMIVGLTDGSYDVDLYEITDSGPVLAKEAPVGEPAPSNVSATFRGPQPDATLAAGSVAIEVTGNGAPLPGAIVMLIPMAAPQGQEAQTAPLSGQSDNQGNTQFTGLVPGAQYRAVVGAFGERFESEVFVVPQSGGMRVSAGVTWRQGEVPEARFTGVAGDKLYFAEVVFRGKRLRSMPFYMAPERGARVNVFVAAQTLFFGVLLAAELDQEYLGFSGQFIVSNFSYAPWDPGPEGLVIPLAKGFLGGVVEEGKENLIKVDPDRGFIWRGPLPPYSVRFMAGFSLMTNQGTVDFDMDLPYGLYQSSIILFKYPGMDIVNLPAGMRPASDRANNGKDVFVLNAGTIQPGQSMVFRVIGLPQRPMGERMLGWLTGGVAVLLLGWGIGGVLWHRSRRGAGLALTKTKAKGDDGERSKTKRLAKRREELLDELVTMEAKKKSGTIADDVYTRERAKLKKQLEAVYAELKEARDSQHAA